MKYLNNWWWNLVLIISSCCHNLKPYQYGVFTISSSMLFWRTLDLGFEKDLTVILNALNATGLARQNVLLSATLTEGKLIVRSIQLFRVCLDVKWDSGISTRFRLWAVQSSLYSSWKTRRLGWADRSFYLSSPVFHFFAWQNRLFNPLKTET